MSEGLYGPDSSPSPRRNARAQYIPLLCVCADGTPCQDGSFGAIARVSWREKAWLCGAFTSLCVLCSLAALCFGESAIIGEALLSLICVTCGASLTGYYVGLSVAPAAPRPSPAEGESVTLEPQIESISLPVLQRAVERTAEEKLKDMVQSASLEGVDDSGWLGEYVDNQDETVTVKNNPRRAASSLTLSGGTHPTSEEPGSDNRPFSVSPEQREFLGSLDWNLDTCRYAQLSEVQGRPILGMGLFLMDSCALVSSIPEWMLKPEASQQGSPTSLRTRVQNFMSELDCRYTDANPYHNGTHAADVMKNIKCFFETSMIRFLMSCREWTWFVTIMAAAIHDMGHTGQTNNYHIAIRSSLALTYNDKSPLEQMHVSAAFQLMNTNPALDWFGVFLKEHLISSKNKMMPIQSRFRRTLIAMVLATDNLKHNECVEKLGKLIAQEKEGITELLRSHSDTQLSVLETILHGADISHPTYDLTLHISWSTRVLEEFWAQGDLEKKALGAASMPMFDRDRMDVPGAQIGFFKFIALGLWEPLVVLLPEMEIRLRQMRRNLAYWEKRKAEGLLALPLPDEWVEEVPQSARVAAYQSEKESRSVGGAAGLVENDAARAAQRRRTAA